MAQIISLAQNCDDAFDLMMLCNTRVTEIVPSYIQRQWNHSQGGEIKACGQIQHG